jgi:hypothetical protein
MTLNDDNTQDQPSVPRRTSYQSLILLVVFVVGMAGGFFMGRESMKTEPVDQQVAIATPTTSSSTNMMHEINPPDGYTIPVKFGDIGPNMIAAGAIDLPEFIQLYEQVGKPLNSDQLDILQKGSNIQVTINQNNAHFLLNFFWALGLVNENKILTEGPMMANGAEQVGGFASTGGWTLGVKAPTTLYASAKIVTLTEEQQKKLLEVATAVYRPCCNNPTHFPDCNHGMAMLGLLELMAAQNASVDEMFEAAKYVNAFWYPQQMLEVATALKATEKVSFAEADARLVVSDQLSSGTGFKAVHQWLATNGLLEQAPSSGGGCGVQ